jgi:hypothetical protein
MGPCPPGKKMASNSLALPRKEDSGAVDSQGAGWELRKDWEMSSLAVVAASMEEGSRGAGPPLGEAKERVKPWDVRIL